MKRINAVLFWLTEIVALVGVVVSIVHADLNYGLLWLIVGFVVLISERVDEMRRDRAAIAAAATAVLASLSAVIEQERRDKEASR